MMTLKSFHCHVSLRCQVGIIVEFNITSPELGFRGSQSSPPFLSGRYFELRDIRSRKNSSCLSLGWWVIWWQFHIEKIFFSWIKKLLSSELSYLSSIRCLIYAEAEKGVA
jgi:hypothetical protein